MTSQEQKAMSHIKKITLVERFQGRSENDRANKMSLKSARL